MLVELLGEEFNGVLGCDYFSAYRKYMREFDVLVQFCMAHLIRDVKFLLTLPGRENQAYGQRVRDAERERPPLVRAHLDGDCHLRPAGSRGLSVLAGLGSSLSVWCFSTLTPAVRPLTTFSPFLFLSHVRGCVIALCHPVNRYPSTRCEGCSAGRCACVP